MIEFINFLNIIPLNLITFLSLTSIKKILYNLMNKIIEDENGSSKKKSKNRTFM